jgi:hypothetical protein
MENFAPANLMSGVAGQYGANVTPPPGSNRVAAPAPTIASTSMAPIAGSENPAPPPGTSQLQDIQGTGAGAQGIVPQGTSSTIGNSGASPSITIPPGGMGMGAFQKVMIPALNAAREGRQFREGQANEESRFERGQNQSHQQFLDSQAAEEGRFKRGKIAEGASKIQPAIEEIGTIKKTIDDLRPLVATNVPFPGTGNVQASLSRRLGGGGTPQMKNSLAIDDAGNTLAAILDKKLAGRFNKEEADALKKSMVPLANDQPKYGGEKLRKLDAFVATLDQGNEQAIRNMASAITGGTIDPTAHFTPTAPSGRSQGLAVGSDLGNGVKVRRVIRRVS